LRRVRRFGGAIAWAIWSLAFRLILGACATLEGLIKLGVVKDGAPGNDFQPSPLGVVGSGALELVVGLFVIVGLRTRTAVVLLAAHLALGVATLPADAKCTNVGLNVLVITAVLIGGATRVSVDHVAPDLIPWLRVPWARAWGATKARLGL
jgi:hypothetical protein